MGRRFGLKATEPPSLLLPEPLASFFERVRLKNSAVLDAALGAAAEEDLTMEETTLEAPDDVVAESLDFDADLRGILADVLDDGLLAIDCALFKAWERAACRFRTSFSLELIWVFEFLESWSGAGQAILLINGNALGICARLGQRDNTTRRNELAARQRKFGGRRAL